VARKAITASIKIIAIDISILLLSSFKGVGMDDM